MPLKQAKSDHLVESLIEELQAWGTEPFDDQRIAEYDAGVLEVARRAKISESKARVWVMERAEANGVQI